MKICQNCNNNCEDFMTFCPNCGIKIEEVVNEPVPETVEKLIKDVDTAAEEVSAIEAELVKDVDTAAEEVSEITSETEETVDKTPNLELYSEPVPLDIEPNNAAETIDDESKSEPSTLQSNEPVVGVRITPPPIMPQDNSIPSQMSSQFKAPNNTTPQHPSAQNSSSPTHTWKQPTNSVPNISQNNGSWNQGNIPPQNGSIPPNQPQNGTSDYNILAIIGIVAGAIGILLFFTFIFPILLGLVAIALGIIYVAKNRKKALGVVSIVMGAVSLIGTVIFGLTIVVGAVFTYENHPNLITEFEKRFNDEFSQRYDEYDDKFRDFGQSDQFSYYIDDYFGSHDNHEHHSFD